MDDKGQQDAQQERDKGAALEYDTEDDTALETPAPASDREKTSQREEK